MQYFRLVPLGLILSQEKTKLTHIEEGFNFLGMNIRKYNGKLIIKPAKSSIKRFLTEIRETIKLNATAKTENLVRVLNQKIKGWANYYVHVCAKKTFNHVDHQIFTALWKWSQRRHPNKGMKWIKVKYYRHDNLQDWIFFARIKDKIGKPKILDIAMTSKLPIKRHIKIRADATPFNPAYHDYFDKRIAARESSKKKSGRKPMWWLCWWDLLKPKKKVEKFGLQKVVLSRA
jgi:RNA-directed DNA polymerase